MQKIKFMEHLSDDVIRENHHLKDELIALRKIMKQYEYQMTEELQHAATVLQITESLSNFSTPKQCLSRFIQLVHESIKKTADLNQQLQSSELSNANLRKKLNHQKTQITQQNQQIVKQQSLIRGSQVQLKSLKQQYQSHIQQFHQKQVNYSTEIQQLKGELETVSRNLHIKYTMEKQTEMEKSNRKIVEFRQKMEKQFLRHEKNLRMEVQKKDRALKSVLFTINNLLGLDGKNGDDILKKAKSKKFKQQMRDESSRDDKSRTMREPAKFIPSQQQLGMLESIIQPFSEHSALNDKIAELRQEIFTLVESKSSIQTSLVAAENTVSQVQTRISILDSQHSLLQENHQALDQKHQALLVSYAKCKKDQEDLESYYERKWNHEFNNVKDNLQKKYADKIQLEENRYRQRLQLLQTERTEVNKERRRIQEQRKYYQNQNTNLHASLSHQKRLTYDCQQQIQKLIQGIAQIQQLHNEDLYSHQYRFWEAKQQMLKEKNLLEQAARGLESQLQMAKEKHKQSVNQIHKTNIDSVVCIKQQIENHYIDIVKQKQTKIEDLHSEIQSHREVLSQLQESVGNQIAQVKRKCNKQQEEAISKIKVEFYEKKQRMNHKIVSAELKFSKLKDKTDLEKDALKEKIKDLNSILVEKDAALAKSDKNLGKVYALRESLELRAKELYHVIAKAKDEKDSLNVLLSSQQKQIEDLKGEISELIASKRAWKAQLNQMKEDMQQSLKQVKKLCDNRISTYRSRIWELEKIASSGWMSMRELIKIRELNEQKKKLQQALNLKEAENLILQQVKQYYENKTKEVDTKLCIEYQLKPLKQKRQVLKRHGLKNQNMQSIKMQVIESTNNFEGQEYYSIKKAIRDDKQARRSAHSRSSMLNSMDNKNNRTEERGYINYKKEGRDTARNYRVNSSLT